MAVILEVENAAFSYNRKRPVFHDISFAVAQGEILSILGRNGIGKSTLIKCILNLMPLQKGRVRLSGKNISSLKLMDMASMVGYVPQMSQVVFPFSVSEFVLMGRAPYISMFKTPGRADSRMTARTLEKVGISHLAHKSIGDISGGERQMVMIARAINQSPRLLILDEPTSHLDVANQIKVLSIIEMLSNEGISVIMTTHFPDHGFLLSQRIAVMQHGRFIAVGNAGEVLTPRILFEAYGVDIDVCYVHEAGRRVCIPQCDFNTGADPTANKTIHPVIGDFRRPVFGRSTEY